MSNRSLYIATSVVLLFGVVTVTSGVRLSGSFAQGVPDQTSTTTSFTSSITFTSPSSGATLSGTQSYTISGTISPHPLITDLVLIEVQPQGSSTVLDVAVRGVTASGTFSYTTNVGGGSDWVSGMYVITAVDSNNATGTTTFDYTESGPQTSTITTATSSSITTSTISTTVTQTVTTTLPATTTTTTSTHTVTGPTTTVTGPTTTVTGPTSTVTSTMTAKASTVTNTMTTTQTATSTATQTSSAIPDWAYGAMVVFLILGLAIGYVVKTQSARQS